MKLLCAALLIAFFSNPAFSAGPDERVMVWGVGTASCAKFLEVMKQNPANDASFVQWLHGYITARNEMNPRVVDYAGGIDRSGLMAWISNYCKDHPLESFFGASVELLRELERTGRVERR